MTNQGYRLTGIGIMLMGAWFIITGIRTNTFDPFNLLIAGSMILCFAGWAIQSSMFSKLKPEDQIRIGYASREDFAIGPYGELMEKSE